ncbi:cupin domain-containing protein [Sneathiella marina]|uniref:Cupin domain-containing protein n=1 Tax=Sneathiella marina TaxID=2950108 RepID=A0ABY4WB75_9PROT|nr:cupin domain-containing protein [Sneathiella marina]USG62509.1 cupin domain-containing protein [Sneathiella marina]
MQSKQHEISDEEVSANSQIPVGQQIRELRRARGLTLTDMKNVTGRSVGNLSEMERGVSPITIEALDAIALALDVSINWFFSGTAVAAPEERDVVVRRSARREINLSQAGTREELLSPNLKGQLELILTTFSPGAGTGDAGRARKGEEGGMIISGTLELSVNGKSYVLEEGDSFQMLGAGKHWCHNPGDVDTVVVWAISPATY